MAAAKPAQPVSVDGPTEKIDRGALQADNSHDEPTRRIKLPVPDAAGKQPGSATKVDTADQSS